MPALDPKAGQLESITILWKKAHIEMRIARRLLKHIDSMQMEPLEI
jgi:hypothetical protein